MSGAQNPLLAPGTTNALMSAPGTTNALTAPPAAQPAAPQQSAPVTPDQFGHLVSGAMRGKDQQTMVQRRDAAGPELEILSRVMNDPDPQPGEVTDYMFALVKSGQVPAKDAIQIIQSMPKDPDALRAWAHTMFSFVMHVGTHAHAAFPREAFPGAPAMPGAPQENGDAAGNEEPAS